jgi:disulfide bond formation protein DsbB
MPPLVGAVNQGLAALTVAAQLAVAVLGSTLLLARQGVCPPLLERAVRRVGERGVAGAFVVAASASASSLFYSLLAGFPPCDLCWYQRAFMYPLALVLGLGLYWRDAIAARRYAAALAAAGGLIAAYHTSLQFDVASRLPCPSTGVSCAQQFVLVYGYVTIPVMSLTAFALVLVLLAAAQRYGAKPS